MFLNSDKTFNYETEFLVPVSQREKLMPDLVKQKKSKMFFAISSASNSQIPGIAKFPSVYPPIMITHLAHYGDATTSLQQGEILFVVLVNHI